MRATYKLTNPADAEATLSLTMTIGFTADGLPRHPLMLSYDTPLIPYEEVTVYYEEKIINGVLHWRGHPDDEFQPYTLEELFSVRIVKTESEKLK